MIIQSEFTTRVCKVEKVLHKIFFNSFLKILKPYYIYIIRITRSSIKVWDYKNPENHKKMDFARLIFTSALRVSTNKHLYLYQIVWRYESKLKLVLIGISLDTSWS